MAIFLDSANLEEIRSASKFDFIAGVTSNPTLLLKGISVRKEKPAGVTAHLKDMADAIGQKLVWSQVPTRSAPEMYEYGKKFANIASDRFVVKLPCTLEGIQAARRLHAEGIKVCVTAVYSTAQCFVAAKENVEYIAPYLGRFTRAGGNALGLLAEMAQVIETTGSKSQLVAASIGSPQEAMDAILAGAHNVTVPYPVLSAWFDQALTGAALQQFDNDWEAVVSMVGE